VSPHSFGGLWTEKEKKKLNDCMMNATFIMPKDERGLDLHLENAIVLLHHIILVLCVMGNKKMNKKSFF